MNILLTATKSLEKDHFIIHGRKLFKSNNNGIIAYSKKLLDRTNYGIKFFYNGNITLLSTSFGIQLNFLLNNLMNIDSINISNHLLEQQNEDGLFIDENFNMADTSGSHDREYILWQFTYFATIAVDMCGNKPRIKFNFLKSLLEKDMLIKLFDELNWKNFWCSSNQIMFLMYFLTYMKERMDYDADLIDSSIKESFDILDSKQDPKTGYWGTDLGGDLYNGMFGSSHIYLFYDYYGKEINYKEKIIDNTLSLQNDNGLFGSDYGGACEDYDAIEVLSKVSKHTDYRRKDIDNAFLKTYKKINSCQQKDGGFSYWLKEDTLIDKIKRIVSHKETKHPTYSYSGWNKMTCDMFVPDIWATYFRTLTIAVIEKDIPFLSKYKYNFYDLPGWGYY